jgi:hypothetical protein
MLISTGQQNRFSALTRMITPIIPPRQQFYISGEQLLLDGWTKMPGEKLDYKAICVFVALGFFLDEDTYYESVKVLKPATNLNLNGNKIISTTTDFKWHYSPRDISFTEAVNEFTYLFEKIVNKQTEGQKVILPLSGGLDSRTQAVAFRKRASDIFAYSYQFKNGLNENYYGKAIAKELGFKFRNYEIEKGYLWEVIGELSTINNCFSDFTSPRQMAFINDYPSMGDVFNLGHWGDVLFDGMGMAEDADFQTQLKQVLKKIIKKGGLELGGSLWKAWGLEGDFNSYLTERVSLLLENIKITNPNSRIRAFKSLYWAPRWTSVNLSVFEKARPITLPYYEDEMCRFICTIPEKYLADRQIQIEYIKRHAPALAKLAWQPHHPYNLYNYNKDKFPNNLGHRFSGKLKRELSAFAGNKYIQRNWELQFLGKLNELLLENTLFDNQKMNGIIPVSLTRSFYEKFRSNDQVNYSHTINMLLVLNKFFN